MASILDLVKHYQHAIEKYPNDEQKILKSIDKLFKLGVTVQHLQETGVGRTVNALRKEPGDVGQAARALVCKWKLMVAAEESDNEDNQSQSATYNSYENGKTPEDSDYESRQKSDQYNKYSKIKTEEDNYSKPQHINGDYSGGKRKYQSSEEEEVHEKKARHASYNEAKVNKSNVQRKRTSESEQDNHSISSHSKHSDSEDSESYEEDKSSKQIRKSEHTEKRKSSSTKHLSYMSEKSHEKGSLSSANSYEQVERHSIHSNVMSGHTSEKSSKDKSSSSVKKDKESGSHKKEKLGHKSSEKEKKQIEDKEQTSDWQKSSPDKPKHNEKSRSHSHRSSSKSDKHSSSQKHKGEKDKDHHSSEKSSSKHKSKEHSSSSSSSSKDKNNSSSKDKTKDKSSSSKDKENSHKSDKKHSSSDTSVKDNSSRNKSEKDEHKSSSSGSSSKEKKTHSSSSHSSKSSKSSSSKSKDIPKKKTKKDDTEDSEDGIDCGSGASFAEALGMVSPSKPKKKSASTKETSYSPNNSGSNDDLSPAALLAPSAKLAPLPALEISALPEISPHYKPRPPPRFLPHFTDEDAISAGISSKNQRTKVYSGNKVLGKIPTLYELCVQVLQEHIDALEFTGGVPYEILKPVVDKATPQQLYMLEHFNPYLMEDTDHLWQKFCEKNFRSKKRQELESWREMYMRCQEEQEHRLKSLTANIKIAQEAKKAPVKQTKMAYVDSVVKPPRNVARKQAQHGTAFTASASPAARVAALAAAPNVLRGGARAAPAAPHTSAGGTFQKPKKAPLMQKALQFMRGRKR